MSPVTSKRTRDDLLTVNPGGPVVYTVLRTHVLPTTDPTLSPPFPTPLPQGSQVRVVDLSPYTEDGRGFGPTDVGDNDVNPVPRPKLSSTRGQKGRRFTLSHYG